jgi:competence protein ComGF
MIELLLYLGLFICLTLILFPLLQHFRTTAENYMADIRLDREWQIFIQQFERELAQANWYSISNGQLELGVNNQVITFERYGSILRRRVFGEGHIVMCQYVGHVSFQPIHSQLLKLEMILVYNGREMKKERILALRTEGVEKDKDVVLQ